MSRSYDRFILVSATRLTLTFKIIIGFNSGVRHPLDPYVQDYYQIDHEPTPHLRLHCTLILGCFQVKIIILLTFNIELFLKSIT